MDRVEGVQGRPGFTEYPPWRQGTRLEVITTAASLHYVAQVRDVQQELREGE